MIQLFVGILLCIILGIILGNIIKKDMQKTQCPYCSCRKCCNIGHDIVAACPENEQKTFVCRNKA